MDWSEHYHETHRWSVLQSVVRALLAAVAVLALYLVAGGLFHLLFDVGVWIGFTVAFPITVPPMMYLGVQGSAVFDTNEYRQQRTRLGTAVDIILSIASGTILWYAIAFAVQQFEFGELGTVLILFFGLLVAYFLPIIVFFRKNLDYMNTEKR